jgi:hypothetical protein
VDFTARWLHRQLQAAHFHNNGVYQCVDIAVLSDHAGLTLVAPKSLSCRQGYTEGMTLTKPVKLFCYLLWRSSFVAQF